MREERERDDFCKGEIRETSERESLYNNSLHFK